MPMMTAEVDETIGALPGMHGCGIFRAARVESMERAGGDLGDSADWYPSPNAAVDRYRALVNQKMDGGAAWIRVVGEVPLEGRSRAESAAWTRYESVVNLAFASSPITFVCPYDTRSLPAEVVDDARRTHPRVAQGSGGAANPAFRDPAEFLLDQQNAPA